MLDKKNFKPHHYKILNWLCDRYLEDENRFYNIREIRRGVGKSIPELSFRIKVIDLLENGFIEYKNVLSYTAYFKVFRINTNRCSEGFKYVSGRNNTDFRGEQRQRVHYEGLYDENEFEP